MKLIRYLAGGMLLFSAASYGADDGISDKITEIVSETDASLYEFSSGLTNALKQCLPYKEDFTDYNPQIKENVAVMFGGIPFELPIEIIGMEGNLCHFSAQYEIMGQKMIYDCRIDDVQRQNLLAAMQDRSRETVTVVFDMPPDNNQKSSKIKLTAGRFTAELTKIQYTACRQHMGTLSLEEQEQLERKLKKLPQEFIEALADCEPSVADFRMLSAEEHVEMLGFVDGKCHLNYRNFDLYVPKEKLKEIQTFDDVENLIYSLDDPVYNYQSAYSYDGLLFELAACYRQTKVIEPNREKINYDDKMEISTGVQGLENEKSCDIELINTLKLHDKLSDYGVICSVPSADLEQIVLPYLSVADQYGEKSFENVDGNIEWHSSTTNLVTQHADGKLMYLLQKNNYCKRKSESINKAKGEL